MKTIKDIRKITSERTPIYPFKEKAYSNALQRLAVWNGNPKNRERLKEFAVHLAVKRDRKRRIMKLIPELMKLSDWLNKDFDQTTYQDTERIISEIHTNDEWSEATKSDYVRAWKTFFIWLEDIDPRNNSTILEEKIGAEVFYKYLHKHVKTTYKRKEIDFSRIISEEDCAIFLTNCRTPLEACVIAILFYTGVRADEILNIRLMDVQLEDKCGMIRVDGKTGQRRIPILEAIPFVMNWVKHHPDQDNPEALLLVSMNNRYQYQPLRYTGLTRLIERVCERSGYLVREKQTEHQIQHKIRPAIKSQKKPCNPHWFRHSRATLWAPLYRESILCSLMGWVQGSEQAKTYVHLGASQVKQAYLQANGIEVEKNQAPEMIKCICGNLASKSQKYCNICYRPLKVDVAIQDELKRKEALNEAMNYLMQIMANPDLRQRFELWQEKIEIVHKP